MKYRNYRLLSHQSDLLRGELSFVYGDGGAEYVNRIKIVFSGVVAHQMEHVNVLSRLYNIEEQEITVESLSETLSLLLERTKLYKFSIKYKTTENLVSSLQAQNIRCFRVLPVEGMFALVFALSYELTETNA